jgi:hypothetical protein
MRFTCPDYTHILHITVHIFQEILTHDCKNIISVILCLSIETTLLLEYVLDAKNKCSFVRQLPIFMGKICISRHYCKNNNTLYISHKAKM